MIEIESAGPSATLLLRGRDAPPAVTLIGEAADERLRRGDAGAWLLSLG